MVVTEIISAIDGCFHWVCADAYFFTPGILWFFLIVFSAIVVMFTIMGVIDWLVPTDSNDERVYGSVEEIPPFEMSCICARDCWLQNGVRSRSVREMPDCPANFDEENIIYGPATDADVMRLNLTADQVQHSWGNHR